MSLMYYNHMYAQIRTNSPDKVARGDFYVTSIPNQSFLQYTWYLVNLNSRLFRQPRQQLILFKNIIKSISTEEAQVMNNPSLLNSITCPELSTMYGRTYIYIYNIYISTVVRFCPSQ